jgi:hypothetical protein
MLRPAALIALHLLLLNTASAAIYCVGGPGGGTTHGSIQAALNSAAANPGIDTIFVIRRDGIQAQGILIENQDVILSGAHVNCDPNEPLFEHTVLNASGGSMTSALIVRSTASSQFMHVEISGFDIVGGDAINGSGGGLRVDGHVDLALSDLKISQSEASNGGGIAFYGTADASMQLGDRVEISNNLATQAGGGLAIFGGSVFVDGMNTSIHGNTAVRDGGGIFLAGAGSANLAHLVLRRGRMADTSGGTIHEIVDSNTSQLGDGGGIAAAAWSDVQGYSVDEYFPVWISLNSASQGGGIAVLGETARVRLWNPVIQGNRANAGGGAVLVIDGGRFEMQDRNDPDRPPDALLCSGDGYLGYFCLIANNIASTVAGDARPGAAVMMSHSAAVATPTRVVLAGARLLDNRGSSVFSDTCLSIECNTSSQLIIRNSLVAYHPETPVLAQITYGGMLEILSSTITGTGAGPDARSVLQTSGNIAIRRSILWEPGRDLIGGLVPTSVIADEVLVSDAGDLGAQAHILVGDPVFVAAGGGDFHLAANSPAVDAATAHPGLQWDADGYPRQVDLPDRPNGLGAADLGAFERQLEDTIFANDFEMH